MIGAVEVLGAVGLLVAGTAIVAVALPGGTRVGASPTRFGYHDMKALPVPLILLGVLTVIGSVRLGTPVARYRRWPDNT